MKNLQIVDFIKRQLQAGESKEKIRNDLLSNGWTNGDINEAMGASTSENMPINPSVKKSSKKILITISLVLLVMLGGGVFAFKVYKNDSISNVNTEGILEDNVFLDKTKSTAISQNVDEVKIAEAQAIQSASEVSGVEPVITAPNENILEPGKPFTVVFASVKNASKYEITITTPARDELGRSIPDKILFKEVTPNTTHTMIVPNSDSLFASEHTYNGEKIIVKALDSQGNVLNLKREYSGRTITAPAISEQQIKILPLPTKPQLLNADKYVLDKEGGTVTLTFGALSAPLKTRKVYLFGDNNLKTSIDSVSLPEPRFPEQENDSLTFGQEAFTKKFIIGNNPYKERDTALALVVKYYDAAGSELKSESQGLKYEPWSWLSIKIKKSEVPTGVNTGTQQSNQNLQQMNTQTSPPVSDDLSLKNLIATTRPLSEMYRNSHTNYIGFCNTKEEPAHKAFIEMKEKLGSQPFRCSDGNSYAVSAKLYSGEYFCGYSI